MVSDTGSRQNKCLSKKSQCKTNLSPKADCCGKIAVRNAILALLTLKPAEDDSVRDEAAAHQGQSL